MGLTSQALLTVLALVALAVCALVIWLWPRVAKKGLLALAGRIGLLVVTQVSILALLLVAGNNIYGFYSTWNELLGRASSRQSLQPGAEGGERVPALTVKGQESAGLKGGREKAGQVDRIEIRGPVSGLGMDGYAYLPPQYFQKEHANEKFPVVVAITGQPGSPRTSSRSSRSRRRPRPPSWRRRSGRPSISWCGPRSSPTATPTARTCRAARRR
ncbi:hypothetical protein QZH56_00090 [Streptomyces olivoreticuli]|uniref:hypothetical protein n=1 Tax=Streptomyces olivoreticuli TaxID=68246 RepID=UPI002657CF43|nr:hypothetical protein [Streptomyces olivoreticuli]WKK24158.1 hypothetical protein QZH56_00090 [Streptomyces olivoreticuli]